ncbi:2'-5' RNA ligase family protein [Candidatus Woesearchaeota archaeon]|nr:2'-5' RNA ligase family protein [Candidatus Woesearchaeota archaeon]
MKSFRDFILEKKITKKDVLYIACPFDKEQVKSLYENFPKKDMREAEDKPHMTVFYSPNANGFDKDELLKFLRSSLKDQEFTGKLTKYKVFKGTDDGESDCLVVEVQVDDQFKKIRKIIVNFLKDKCDNLEITYPTWKPHMTIGYYEVGQVPEHGDFEPVDITLKNFFCKFGDSSTKPYKL